jgi:hypothetical protein
VGNRECGTAGRGARLGNEVPRADRIIRLESGVVLYEDDEARCAVFVDLLLVQARRSGCWRSSWLLECDQDLIGPAPWVFLTLVHRNPAYWVKRERRGSDHRDL